MKIGPKEAQRAALRQRSVSVAKDAPKAKADPGPLRQEHSDPKGLGIPVKFDRNAYQREYMRKRRARLKGKP